MSLIIGGAGPDTLDGDGSNDDIRGFQGNDQLFGHDGDDTLDGGTGNDYLDGGKGNDLLIGGDGDDTMTNLDGGVFQGGAGSDRLVFSLYDAFLGIDGSNQYIPLTFDGSTGTGTAITFSFSDIEAFSIDGAQSSPNHFTGGVGNDVFTGGDMDDVLIGGDGDDILTGALGHDVLNGGAGIDTANYANTHDAYTAVAANLATGVANMDGSVDTLISIENLIGSAFNDELIGDDNANVLTGGAGDDVLDGGKGNDTLNGGDGNDLLRGGLNTSVNDRDHDILDGGAGVDLVTYNDRLYPVVVNLATGVTFGGFFTDELRNIEDVVGTQFNDTLTGDSGANRLDGYLGDDIIDGGGGNDVLYGGGGTDTVSFVNETAGVTVDLVTGVATGDSSGVDVLVGFTNITLSNQNDHAYGDAANNLIVGYAGDDYIDGRGGDDILNGYDGNDTLIGGDGDDQLSGGGGGDILIGGSGNDFLRGGYGHDILMGGAGDDFFDDDGGDDAVSYQDATSGVTVSTLIHTAQDTGGAGMDTFLRVSALIGSDFNDTLAAATVTGGKGDDNLDGLGFGTASYADATGGVIVDLSVTTAQHVGGGLGVDTLTHFSSLMGSAYNDILGGDGADNWLQGGTGDDKLLGGGGNDTLIGGAGADIMDGGAGVDIVSYQDAASGIDLQMIFTVAQNTLGGGIDTLIGIEGVRGSDFNDVLAGDAGANRLDGGLGDDILKGGAGDDILYGDQPSPAYNVVGGKDVLEGGAGNDTLYASDYVGGDDILRGGDGNDTIVSDNKIMAVYGDDGNDILQITNGERSGVMDGGAGDDILQARSVDISDLTLTGVETLSGEDVTATAQQFAAFTTIKSMFFGVGAAIGLVLAEAGTIDFSKNVVGGGVEAGGSSGADDITGTSFVDTINGGDGDDILHAGGGADTLYDGRGSDKLYSGDGADFLSTPAYSYGDPPDAGYDQFFGEGGADTFSIVGPRGAFYADGGADNDLFYIGSDLNGAIEGGSGYDTITLYSGDIHNLTITGVERLNGGVTATAEQFSGFTTIASYYGDARPITNLVLASAGTVNFGLNVIAGASISVTGSSGDDTITGTASDDTLNGAAGHDILDGGAGSDTIIGGDGLDKASYQSATSGVTVSLALTTQNTGGGGVDTFSGIEGVIGSNHDDILHAGAADAYLDGAGGDDLVFGGGGADTLLGGEGNDHLYGSAGFDVLQGDAGYDFARYDASSAGVTVDMLNGVGSGGDAAGDVLIKIEGLVGSAFADRVIGNSADNVIYGQGGDDILSGGFGADTLEGGDGDDQLYGEAGGDILRGGAGFDFARYDYDRGPTSVSLETGAGTAGEAFGDVLVDIEGLYGSSFGDTLVGNGGGNVIYGQSGDDVIRGGGGADTLNGGAGNDHLYGGIGADILIGGAGLDLVRYDAATSSVGVDLAAQHGFGAGSEADDDIYDGIEGVVGSAFADILRGDAQANILYGLNGDDVLDGGAGDDMISGDDGNDHVYDSLGADRLDGGAGFDLLRFDLPGAAGVVVDLKSGITAQGDVLSGFEGVVATNQNDVIYGGNGDDLIYALAGEDHLIGGGGNDTLYGGNGDDKFFFDSGSGADKILDFDTIGADHDVIAIQKSVNGSNIVDFTTLMAHAQDTVSGVQIDLGSGASISLMDVHLSALTADLFAFY